MPSVTKTVDLPLGQDEAFALATDAARFEEWLTIHKSWPSGAPAETATGEKFVQQVVIMGMPANVDWTVEEYDAPNRLVLRGAGPMGATLATTIAASSTGESSTISYEAEFSGGGIQGPMGEMVTKQAGQELETSLGKLAALAG